MSLSRPVSGSLDAMMRAALGNRWVSPRSSRFDTARRVFNGDIDRQPRGIAYCSSTADVRRVLDIAGTHGRHLTVRSSGHNVAGRAVADDHVVVDLSLLGATTVFPGSRRATCGPGATWGSFDAATQRFGLATTGGTVTTTGVGGLTLGGGVGWLLPSFGLTCDSLIAASVVRTDGSLVEATDEDEAELMWALRGGGFGLGIVVSLDFELHHVPGIIGGAITYGIADARTVLASMADAFPLLDDRVMISPALLHMKGRPVLELDIAINGDAAAVERFLRFLPRGCEPLDDTLHSRAYSTMQCLLDNPFRHGMHAYWKSGFVDVLSDEAIEVLVAAIEGAPTKESLIMIEHYHGAYARPARASAFPNRDDDLNVLFVSNWDSAHAPDMAQRCRDWARESLTALPGRKPGAYSNYLAADDSAPASTRLQAVRRQLDPDGRLKWE